MYDLKKHLLYGWLAVLPFVLTVLPKKTFVGDALHKETFVEALLPEETFVLPVEKVLHVATPVYTHPIKNFTLCNPPTFSA